MIFLPFYSFEASSRALCFIVMYLSQNPTIQNELRDEINEQIPDDVNLQ